LQSQISVYSEGLASFINEFGTGIEGKKYSRFVIHSGYKVKKMTRVTTLIYIVFCMFQKE